MSLAVAHAAQPANALLNRRAWLAFGAATGMALATRAVRAELPGTLTAVTLIHGLPGRGDDLKAHLLALAAPTRAESGCILYDLYQSPNEPHEFMRFEIWQDAAALERHKQTPHLRASFEKRQREGWTTRILTWQRVPE
jgi:quinol monooxygenase YgiN